AGGFDTDVTARSGLGALCFLACAAVTGAAASSASDTAAVLAVIVFMRRTVSAAADRMQLRGSLGMASLADVDLSERLGKEEGEKKLSKLQQRLLEARLELGGLLGDGTLGPPLCVLFEGWDASGKGGAIKRLVAPLDPRHVAVAQFAAPTPREKRHHFLWRFWPALPGRGGMCVLDRSWYGRVLVERVEGFATKAQWKRAYGEIVSFEEGLCRDGMILVKLWLHISPEEQLRRFEEREKSELKRWKLTD